MNVNRLIQLIESPQVQSRILGNYKGSTYSIGVTKNPDPNHDSPYAIRLRIARNNAKIPTAINLDGEIIPIVVQDNYLAPQPF